MDPSEFEQGRRDDFDELQLLRAIVRTLALSTPDVTEDGEQWCAVCDTELHKGWPSWDEHREDCAYKRAHDYVSP